MQDEHYIAFRDHNPSTKFHFLVIPKRHYGKRFLSHLRLRIPLAHDVFVFPLRLVIETL